MKDLKQKTKISVVIFLVIFFLPLCFLRTTLTTNMNLNLLASLHIGDFNRLFTVRQVSSRDYISVMNHEFIDDLLVIDFLSTNLLSPIEGIIVRRGNDRGNRFIVIQTNGNEYKISGLDSFNVFVFNQVRPGDVIGQITNDDGLYRVLVQNLHSNTFIDVVMLINEYEEI